MSIDEMEKLARAIDEFDPEEADRVCGENNEPTICVACGGEYRILEPGQEPTALDDACAHATVTDLARALLSVLPVVRAAEKHEDARRECQRTGRGHGALVLASEALEDAIDQMRREMGDGK